MEERKRSFLGRTWGAIDGTRRFVLNVLFLAIVVAVVVVLVRNDTPDVPSEGALVLRPDGPIVEQLAGDPVERLQRRLMGEDTSQTLLKDLVDAVEAATDDDRIRVLVLDLSRMGSARVTSLEILGEAIDRFRETGKTVVAAADVYDQYGYALAAHADEIWVHPMGAVVIQGFGRYRMYYKDLLDRIDVDWHVFRVGEYKSAVEPYLRSDMSDEAREANLAWLGDLWDGWLDHVSAARGIARDDLLAYAQGMVDRLEAAGGDAAVAALDAGLVDHVAPRDAIRDRLVELVGEDEDGESYARIGHDDYLETLDDRFGAEADGDVVAVVVAVGTILDGVQPAGAIGGDSTAALIRRARQDEDVKAIVLRVDSGGGSAFASEVIRRELELAREQGKVVVSSMGGVAASGGYWITMASDEVWAHPDTITGSIGIFAMFPTVDRALAKHLGLRVDGVGTTRFSGVRPDRPLDPEIGRAVQILIDQGYREFIGKAAAARGMTPEELDAVARGRVWSGRDAHEVGLIDRLGGFDEAVASAAERAGIADDHELRWIVEERGWRERLTENLLGAAIRVRGAGVARPPALTRALNELARRVEPLAELNDPNGVYAWFPYEGP